MGMRNEITSTNSNAAEHISEKYRTNLVKHKWNVFLWGGNSLEGTIEGK